MHQASPQGGLGGHEASSTRTDSEPAEAEDRDEYDRMAWEELECTGELLMPDGQPWQAGRPGPLLEAHAVSEPEALSAGSEAKLPEAAIGRDLVVPNQGHSTMLQAASAPSKAAASDAPADSDQALQASSAQSSGADKKSEPMKVDAVAQLASPMHATSPSFQAESHSASTFCTQDHSATEPQVSLPAVQHAEPQQSRTGLNLGLGATDKAIGSHRPSNQHQGASHFHSVDSATTLDDINQSRDLPGSDTGAAGHTLEQMPVEDQALSRPAEPTLSSGEERSSLLSHDPQEDDEANLERPGQPGSTVVAGSDTQAKQQQHATGSVELLKSSNGAGKDYVSLLRQQTKGLPANESHETLRETRQSENVRYAADWETESESSASPAKQQASPD